MIPINLHPVMPAAFIVSPAPLLVVWFLAGFTLGGVHQVTEGGPRRVWRIIEDAHALWTTLGQPGWERFGLTVTEHHQHLWLDDPAGRYTWPLMARRAHC